MKISIIMLTYNREMLVKRAIESIIGQTFTDFEYLIVDNGSTDKSGIIADEYAQKDCRIRVIHRERGNIGSGRNAGLNAARGEYIAFIDDDDWCEPDFLAFLYSLITKYQADVAICGTLKWENGIRLPFEIEKKPLVMGPETAILELLWRRKFNNGFPTKLFKRSVFGGLSFPEQGLYDDIHVMYKMIANAKKIVSYGVPKYNVLRHSGNNSVATTKYGMITADYIEEYRKVYQSRADWLSLKFPGRKAYWNYFNWSFQLSMVNKIIKYNLPDCDIHLSEMCRELASHCDEFMNSEYIQDFEREWMKIALKFEKEKVMKHIIWGGFDYAVYYEMDQNAVYQGIDYFVDTNPELIGTSYLGKLIKAPTALLKENKEEIIILIGSIIYRTEIAFQLIDMGFEEGKHFEWAIAFTGDNKCRRLWKHTEWIDPVANKMNLAQCKDGEYSLSRLDTAARLIDFNKCKTLIDLGSGHECIRKFLQKDIRYIPVDYIRYTDETLICNINNYEFPLDGYNVNDTCILSIGNIQYCSDWKWYIRTVTEHCICFILGHDDFSRISREYRKTHWTRYNALFDHEIIRYVLSLGFQLTDSIDFRLKTVIYKFEKRG